MRSDFYPTGVRQHQRAMFNRLRLITVRRTGAIGDVLAATGLANALNELGCAVRFQCDPVIHPVLRRHRGLQGFSAPTSPPDVNLDGAYESHPERTKLHWARIFTDSANRQLARKGIHIPSAINFAPRLQYDAVIRRRLIADLFKHQKPWVMICPRSNSWPNRTVPDDIWTRVASGIRGTKFWIGNSPAPAGFIDLACRDLDTLCEYIGCADLLISVDTGPMHIAAALGTPVIVVGQSSDPVLHLSDQRDWLALYPPLDCLNCQLPVCPIDAVKPPCQNISPQLIAGAVNSRLGHSEGCVSAIISVYKPKPEHLTKCLTHLLPQVDEVIIVGDLDTPWPLIGIPDDPKIKCVRKPSTETGYGKNANYAVRHSKGSFLLFVNDDCYLNPGCAAELLKQMKDESVAIVTHLLRYPNGLVQYGGKCRSRGDVGFGHIDHNKARCRYESPVEQESACGASMLVRRSAFYEADGYSEAYRLYSEDDHFSMAVRQNGWRIMFTPHAVGIHDEHTSSATIPAWHNIMKQSSEIFAKRWRWYFEKNRNVNVIGKF